MTEHAVHDILATLYNLRGLTDSELLGLLDAAASGDADAIEWAAARMADLDHARSALEVVLLAAMDDSRYVPINVAAAELGVTPSALYRRLNRLGLATVEAPRGGRGPRTGRYMRRADLPELRRRGV